MIVTNCFKPNCDLLPVRSESLPSARVSESVCKLETGPHSTAALMQARPRGGALCEFKTGPHSTAALCVCEDMSSPTATDKKWAGARYVEICGDLVK